MKLTTRVLTFAVAATATLAAARGFVDVVAATDDAAQQQGGGMYQGRGWPPPDATPEDRAKIEAALPAKAPATPKQPRKLLVYDLNIGYPGHWSIPHANLAAKLMGEKTGAYTATLSRDPAVLEPESLRQFDAVYLNSTNGDIFATPRLRQAFADFIRNGGGLVANHASTMVATHWPEFAEIIGARGAYHREADEKLMITVEEPDNPITRPFGAGPFEFVDEFYRYPGSFSRERSRVLLSIDPNANDMMQGRCYGVCLTENNEYPVAWVQRYGKGRVFNTTIGHERPVFYDARVLEMLLAAFQYALGDLPIDDTPRPRGTQAFDTALAAVAKYDWGQDRAPIPRFERELALLAATPAGATQAEDKMLAVLQSNAPRGAKDAICKQLAIFGSSRAVPVLEQLARNAELESVARYALQGIQQAR